MRLDYARVNFGPNLSDVMFVTPLYLDPRDRPLSKVPSYRGFEAMLTLV